MKDRRRFGDKTIALEEHCIPVAQVNEVDENSAVGSWVGIAQVAVIGVYVDGLRVLRVLVNVASVIGALFGFEQKVGRTRYALPSPLTNRTAF